MRFTNTETNDRSPALLSLLRISATLGVLLLGYGAIIKLVPSAGADQRAATPLAGTMAGWLESESGTQRPGAVLEQHFPAEPLEVYPGQIDWTPLPPGTRPFE